MKPTFSIYDNALCLACCKLRLRREKFLRGLVLLGLALACAILFYELNILSFFPGFGSHLFFSMYCLQCVILALGAFRVSMVTERERVSGTLDLHRLSPQSRTRLVLGLLFGGGVLEWALALVLMPVLVTVGAVIGLSFAYMVLHQCALFLGALTLGQLSVIATLAARGESLRVRSSNFFIELFLICNILIGLFAFYDTSTKLTLGSYSVAFHTFTPYMLAHIGRSLQAISRGGETTSQIPFAAAFGLQAVGHLTLLSFGVWVAARHLKYRDKPPFSKTQAYVAAMILYAFYVAELVNNAQTLSAKPFLVLLLAPLTVLFGVFIVFVTTPKHRAIIRGYHLDPGKEQEKWPRAAFSEYTSLRHWLSGYVLLTLLAIVPAWLFLHGEFDGNAVRGFAWFLPLFCGFALAQVGSFAGFVEFALLGGFRRNVLLFPLMILVFWVLAPILGMVLGESSNSFLYNVSVVFSPLVACPSVLVSLTAGSAEARFAAIYVPLLGWGIAVNSLAAAIFFSIAARFRKHLYKFAVTRNMNK